MKNLSNDQKKIFAKIARLKIKRDKTAKDLENLDQQLEAAKKELKI